MIKSYGHISKADECQLDEPQTEYDQVRADYERLRLSEEIRIVSAWKAANGYDDLLRAYAASVDEVRTLRDEVARLHRKLDEPSELARALAFMARQHGIGYRVEEIFRIARKEGWEP